MSTPASPVSIPLAGLDTEQAHPPISTPVGPATISLLEAPDGASQVSLQLTPDEMGNVSISVERQPGGAARIVVGAVRPDTLRELAADHAHLHAVLDAAAVPVADRTLQFELLPPAPASSADDASRSSGQLPSGSFGDGHPGGRENAGAGGGPARPSSWSGDHASPAPGALLLRRWRLGGIDITA